ncbi:MAG: Flp family type IVb pilin [Acidobacteria bacterium]|nr:Flp family type IVb pilin [Acidobacteriota bacterium]
MLASFFHALTAPLKQLRGNRLGQDLLEYALIAGLIALGAGALMPGVATSISTIHSRISSQAVRIASF